MDLRPVTSIAPEHELPSAAPIVSVGNAPLIYRPGRTAGTKDRGWLTRRFLAIADVVALTLAFLVAALLVNTPSGDVAPEIAVFALTTPCWIVLARLFDLYDRD